MRTTISGTTWIIRGDGSRVARITTDLPPLPDELNTVGVELWTLGIEAGKAYFVRRVPTFTDAAAAARLWVEGE